MMPEVFRRRRRAVSSSAQTSVSDSFNRADNNLTLGNADTGQTWVYLGGTWGILGNRAYLVSQSGNGGSTNNCYAVIDSGRADATVQVTVAVSDITEEPRLCFRASDINNLWIVSGAGILYKRVAGTYTQVGSSFTALATGDVVTVVLSGTSITVKVNGSTVVSATDAFNATATQHGLGQLLFNTSTVRLDDFSVL